MIMNSNHDMHFSRTSCFRKNTHIKTLGAKVVGRDKLLLLVGLY